MLSFARRAFAFVTSSTFAIALLTACVAEPNPYPVGGALQPSATDQIDDRLYDEFGRPRLSDRERLECLRQGGFEDAFLEAFCNFRNEDAGRPCSNSSQCQGECVHRTELGESDPVRGQRVAGQCTTNRSFRGCYTTIENGRAVDNICAS